MADKIVGSASETLTFRDEEKGVVINGTLSRGVYHPFSYKGQDFSDVQIMGQHLSKKGCTRILVKTPQKSEINERLMQAGFHHPVDIANEGQPLSWLAYNLADLQNSSNEIRGTFLPTQPTDMIDADLFCEVKKPETLKKVGFFLYDKEDGDKIVGGAFIKIFSTHGETPPVCELIHLWVKDDPRFRGKGYGKKVMDFVEAEAKKADCAKVELFSDGFYSWQFYPKIGYTLTATLPKLYYDGKETWYAGYKLEKLLKEVE